GQGRRPAIGEPLRGGAFKRDRSRGSGDATPSGRSVAGTPEALERKRGPPVGVSRASRRASRLRVGRKPMSRRLLRHPWTSSVSLREVVPVRKRESFEPVRMSRPSWRREETRGGAALRGKVREPEKLGWGTSGVANSETRIYISAIGRSAPNLGLARWLGESEFSSRPQTDTQVSFSGIWRTPPPRENTA
ncbi:MAG: hypothetical protein RI967_1129, partial [Planctomycetota bacterium]